MLKPAAYTWWEDGHRNLSPGDQIVRDLPRNFVDRAVEPTLVEVEEAIHQTSGDGKKYTTITAHVVTTAAQGNSPNTESQLNLDNTPTG